LNSILEQDLIFIRDKLKTLYDRFVGKKLMVTGATGFFGKNLIQSIAFINRDLIQPIELTLISREPSDFLLKFPVNDSSIKFIKHNLEQELNIDNNFDYILNAVVISPSEYKSLSPEEIYNKIIAQTKTVIDFSIKNPLLRVLHFSSGAVYGALSENSFLETDVLPTHSLVSNFSAYAMAKAQSEEMFYKASDNFGLNFSIVRCFSFMGPYLPLDTNYAVGNFIKNILDSEDIVINSDGLALRSYLYSADFVIWSLTILLMAKPGTVYNLGSDQIVSIKDLAYQLSIIEDSRLSVKIRGYNSNDSILKYIPNINKARNELGLEVYHDLQSSLKRTLAWNKLIRSEGS
jgi:nucleoside-diphosphate-sugar epimerase